MPTGYTCGVADGSLATVRDYALVCARAFGALITMRDEPFDKPIPAALEADTRYHDEKLQELRAKLSALLDMDASALAAEQERLIAEAESHRDEYLAGKAAQRARYDAMLAQVEAWTTDAEGIRDFMLSQLRESITFDCGGDYVPAVPDRLPPSEWLGEQMKRLSKEIAYHEEGRAKEIARTSDRNAWLKALRDSLPPLPVATAPVIGDERTQARSRDSDGANQ